MKTWESLGIDVSKIAGQGKTTCPKCSDSRKKHKDPCLSVNIAEGVFNCFAGETKVLTKTGIFRMDDLVGKECEVLDSDRNWVKTKFEIYGRQSLDKITLSRNGVIKTIYATSNHRWFARGCVNPIETKNLRKGHRLLSNYPKPLKSFSLNESGIRHGFIFGDGTIEARGRSTRAYFCAHKDSYILKYFKSKKLYTYPDRKISSGWDKSYKNLPDLDSSNEYILGFLAGYFAADGDVGGMVNLNCSDKITLEHIRNLCTKVGIGTYGTSSYIRKGYNGMSPIFRLRFLSSTLQPEFFLNPEHKKRFLGLDNKFERTRWQVISVEKTDRIEDVYCCSVYPNHNFTLEDNLLTSNCHHC